MTNVFTVKTFYLFTLRKNQKVLDGYSVLACRADES